MTSGSRSGPVCSLFVLRNPTISIDQADALRRFVNENESVQQQIQSAANDDSFSLVAFAAEHGFEFTSEEAQTAWDAAQGGDLPGRVREQVSRRHIVRGLRSLLLIGQPAAPAGHLPPERRRRTLVGGGKSHPRRFSVHMLRRRRRGSCLPRRSTCPCGGLPDRRS